MPFVHVGAPHRLTVAAIVLLVAVAILAGVWVRTRAGATDRPGRRREFGWCAGLIVAGGMLAASLGSSRWALVVAAATIVVTLVRPRLAVGFVPPTLMLLGLTGIGLAGTMARGGLVTGWYGIAPAVAGQMSFVLVQAYAFLLLGGWLGWRELRRHPGVARAVLGRLADVDPRDQLWCLALLLVVVVGAAIINSGAWFPFMIALAAVSVLILRRSPSLAARLTAVGLIVVGLAGLLLIKNWPSAASFTVSPRSGAPALARLPTVPPVPGQPIATVDYVRYGALDLQNNFLTDLAAVEAFAFLGLGGWLVPRSFPSVRRVFGLVPQAQVITQVRQLTESRAVAVDTAAADLRRLERDLHDGAQARLVALGMNLRAAERLMHTSPDAAAALVAEAREASARALTELRELVRGVHPPVLADRGLADAVRALALDSPLHVETEVDMAGRLAAPIETACYFCVAELLTNAAKHSGARDARIAIRHAAGLLRIEVTDFGLGGADPAAGSGLAGIERRLASFDGILALSSPPGGPTIAVLEVPCALSSPKISSC
jgi:signal transduction histidine kinase